MSEETSLESSLHLAFVVYVDIDMVKDTVYVDILRLNITVVFSSKPIRNVHHCSVEPVCMFSMKVFYFGNTPVAACDRLFH